LGHAGQEEYDHIRPLSYPETDIFLVCFSVDSQSSFRNIDARWHPEIKEHEPDKPFIVVGTKMDLREDEELVKKLEEDGNPMKSFDEYKEAALAMGAEMYIECSAMTRENLDEVFEQAVRVSRKYKP